MEKPSGRPIFHTTNQIPTQQPHTSMFSSPSPSLPKKLPFVSAFSSPQPPKPKFVSAFTSMESRSQESPVAQPPLPPTIQAKKRPHQSDSSSGSEHGSPPPPDVGSPTLNATSKTVSMDIWLKTVRPNLQGDEYIQYSSPVDVALWHPHLNKWNVIESSSMRLKVGKQYFQLQIVEQLTGEYLETALKHHKHTLTLAGLLWRPRSDEVPTCYYIHPEDNQWSNFHTRTTSLGAAVSQNEIHKSYYVGLSEANSLQVFTSTQAGVDLGEKLRMKILSHISPGRDNTAFLWLRLEAHGGENLGDSFHKSGFEIIPRRALPFGGEKGFLGNESMSSQGPLPVSTVKKSHHGHGSTAAGGGGMVGGHLGRTLENEQSSSSHQKSINRAANAADHLQSSDAKDDTAATDGDSNLRSDDEQETRWKRSVFYVPPKPPLFSEPYSRAPRRYTAGSADMPAVDSKISTKKPHRIRATLHTPKKAKIEAEPHLKLKDTDSESSPRAFDCNPFLLPTNGEDWKPLPEPPAGQKYMFRLKPESFTLSLAGAADSKLLSSIEWTKDQDEAVFSMAINFEVLKPRLYVELQGVGTLNLLDLSESPVADTALGAVQDLLSKRSKASKAWWCLCPTDASAGWYSIANFFDRSDISFQKVSPDRGPKKLRNRDIFGGLIMEGSANLPSVKKHRRSKTISEVNSPDPLSLPEGPATGGRSRQPSTPTPKSKPLQQSPNINLRASIVLPQKPASTTQSHCQQKEEDNPDKVDIYTLEQTIMEKEQELRSLREELGRRSYD